MQTKRRNAPFLKDQPQNAPFEDIIILAGLRAWEAYGKDGKGEEWQTIRQALNEGAIVTDGATMDYAQKPIILGERELKQIDCLQLLPQGHKFARIYQTGALSEAQKTAICLNLAKHTQAQSVGLFAGVDDEMRALEQWGHYLKKLREDETQSQMAQKIAQTAQKSDLDLSADKPTQKEIAEAFLEWHAKPLGRDIERAKTLEYNGKYWQEKSEEELRRLIMAFYDAHNGDYTAKKLSSISALVELKVESIPEQKTDFIGFQNGVLNKTTGEFNAHSIKHYLRGIEAFDCNPNRTDTPLFNDWLEFVSQDDTAKRNAILAGFYMILTNRHEWGLFLEATGTGGAGKSVMAQIATVINGTNNTAAITLERLEDPSGKGRAVLLGRSFAYAPDQAQYKGSADTLKAITGGDQVTIKPLYVDEFSMRLDLTYMIVTNHPLQFIDRNGAILRRRVIIVFDKAIPKEKKDVHFAERLKGEVFGIVNKLLARFPDPEEARLILEEYRDTATGNKVRSTASHLVDFAGHFLVKDERKGALRVGSGRDTYHTINHCDTFYAAYTFYCECHGLKRLNLRTFKEAIPDAFREIGEKIPYSDKMYCGYPTTNVYWKHKDLTLRQWQG